MDGLEMYNFNSDKNQYLYHYTSYTTALEKILPTRSLRLSPFRKTNDPRENKDWQFQPRHLDILRGHFEIQKQFNALLKDNCKMICFSRDKPDPIRTANDTLSWRGYSHSRMWAQYAGNHTGICLVFDKYKLGTILNEELSKKGFLYDGPVQYGTDLLDIADAFLFDYQELQELDLFNYARNHVEKYVKELFFEKLQDWKDEWEYRWVFFADEKDEYVFVKFQDALAGIILGVDFPFVYDNLVFQFCKEANIPVYRMFWPNGTVQIMKIFSNNNPG